MARFVAVGHVGVRARDLDALTAFYRDVLGLRLVVLHAGIVAIFALGDTPTDLFLEPGESKPVAFDLAADDVGALRAALVAKGVACSEVTRSKTSGHHGFAFRDPEGNEIHVTDAHTR